MIIKLNPIIKRISLLVFILLYTTSLQAQTYVSAPVSGTITSGTYYANGSITIVPTTVIAPGAGQSVLFYIPSTACIPLATVYSQNQNYVSTITPRIPGFTSSAQLTDLSTCQAMQTIQYLDGLGRPLQTVAVKGNPIATRDVIQPVEYDQYGREAKKYLPYTDSLASPGTYRGNALTGAQNSFYQQTGQNYINIPSPYALTNFEPSPLNRMAEQGAPGAPWQPAISRTTTGGRTIVAEYGVNTAGEVAFWTISSNGASGSTTYAAGLLTKTISKDENWVSGKSGTTEEFKDMQEHVILKRVWSSESASLSTYYVYNDLDNLAYVIPPGFTATSFTEADAAFSNFIYAYRYDERNRLARKKLPGKGWEYVVYNKLDEVVATQDAIQRNKAPQEWTISRYDAMGRVVLTGIYQYGATAGQDYYSDVKTQAEGQTNPLESYTGSTANYGYSNTSFPANISKTLSVNYYDGYGFAGSNPYPYSAASTMTRGLLTGTLINVLNTTDMLWTVHYYNDRGREVKTYQQHYLGGTISAFNYDDITTAYEELTGAVTAVTRQHNSKNSANTAAVLALTVKSSYAYDHLGRKTKTWQRINTGDSVLLSKVDYNEVGQLYRKQMHSADGGGTFKQDIVYRYNERGWLRSVNSVAVAPATNKLFSLQLDYNQTDHTGATQQFNGNISEQLYNAGVSGSQYVTYSYDALNRLNAGVSSESFSESGITYDAMGNILTLSRTGAPNVAALSYSYTGNQLTAVTNSGTSFRIYSYDANGNATGDGLGNAISYNMLNLPQSIPGKSITYVYDAAGRKLRKISNGVVTEYIDGIQYAGTAIDFVQTEEGRILNPTTSPNYEYTLKDHLGNNRVTFDQSSGKVGEDNYYPFGLNVHRQQNAGNKYLYNGKEIQDDLNNQYDYGARFYDPVIARWTSVDPLAEDFERSSTYNYGVNNPILMIDRDGMAADSTNKPVPVPSPKPSVDPAGFVLPLVNLATVVISGSSVSVAAEAGPYVLGLYGAWQLGQWGGQHPREYEQWFTLGLRVWSSIQPVNLLNRIINLPPIIQSKGGPRNIWPDEYGYPPNVKDVDWKKSDGQLADELSKAHNDPKKGGGTANNLARKWFRDKRPKN